jgi:membrane protein YqaA with SNARE-associated domain
MAATLHQQLSAQIGAGYAEPALMQAAAVETLGASVRADLLLADRVVLAPKHAFAAVVAATMGSVLAGLVLYLVGWGLGKLGLLPLLVHMGLGVVLGSVQLALDSYAPLLLVAAGIATVPFAGLLVIAGLLGVAPLWLLPAAIVARGFRYSLPAWLLWRGGLRYRDWLNRNYQGLTLVVALGLVLLAVFFILLKYT